MSALQVSVGSSSKSRFLGSTVFSSRFLRIALLTMAGLAGTASADAAVFWSDEDPMVMTQPMPPAPPPRQKKPRRAATYKLEKPARETAKPIGPLVIAISIDRQTLKLYDANGLFAETPISTGMRGHSTPMGVFSVIQKNKWHRSNIYSGAPMPYMQRITWSGIAMHAGVLPGYPASHGCIRMPMAFAAKMWGWTRMGARVVITPGEISPSEFSHPLLIAHKPEPAPTATIEAKDTPPTAKADKAVPAADAKPAMSSASLELKPALEAERAKTVSDAKRDQTQTADASGVMAPPAKSAIISDASPAKADNTVRVTRRDVDEAAAKIIELSVPEAKPSEPAPSETVKAAASNPPVSAPDVKKDETRPADAGKAAAVPSIDPSPAVAAAPKRSGQIAVLVSRKDGKLYVRQNFAPLFDVPITIAASDRPFGTHVFTARTDKDDAKALHWSAVSLPAVPRRSDEDDSATRRRKSTGAIEMKTTPLPNSAAEALDRLTIPADAMARITDVLASGSSIIVSDQGIRAGGETGEGTEFVVPLR
ncbi:lipoprotein-anchoring transpeptidase ErfK/SrfK [Nitrobacteraceae bacterium AZCC 2146]